MSTLFQIYRRRHHRIHGIVEKMLSRDKKYTVRVNARSMRGIWTTGCLAGWMCFNPQILAPLFYCPKLVQVVVKRM
jgi:hypothetical protein